MRHVQRGDLIDPDLLERWAHGWACSRGKPPPTRDGAALRINVGEPGHVRRYVFPSAPHGVAEIAAQVSEPGILLKVPLAEAAVRLLLTSDWTAEQTGTVMSLDNLPVAPAPVADATA